MTKKTGKQVSDSDVFSRRLDDVLSGCLDGVTGTVKIAGVEVELIGGMITKRDAQRVMVIGLSWDERTARASVSSYHWEGWTGVPSDTTPRINDEFAKVSSVAARMQEQINDRAESSRMNGALGGRPQAR